MICDGTVNYEQYDEGECDKCGQRWSWQEGMEMELTDEQWALLRGEDDKSR